MKIYSGIDELIGKTPLMEVENFSSRYELFAKILIKIERFNPAGSVKDRAAKFMIDDAEEKALEFFCYLTRSQLFIDGNKRVAQLVANKILIEHDIGIFQIPIQRLEQFKYLLVNYYETNNSQHIKSFMRNHCVKRIRKEG